MTNTKIITPMPSNAHIQFTLLDPLDVSKLTTLLYELDSLQDSMPGLYIPQNRRMVRIVDVTGTVLHDTSKHYDVGAVVALINIMGVSK